jgi:4-hydroxy-tetrahydrodipicolinate reductase
MLERARSERRLAFATSSGKSPGPTKVDDSPAGTVRFAGKKSKQMKLALHGATGRMGLTIARLALEAGDIQIVGAATHPEDPSVGRDLGELAGKGSLGVAVGTSLADALLGADVVIDFSLPPALGAVLHAVTRAKVPVVIGTTGFSEQDVQRIDAASKEVPLLWSQNMSVGVAVLAVLVRDAVQRLGPAYDAEIVEIHHRRKVDSPSGTAKRLADAVVEARPEVHSLYERAGQVGARTSEEMGVFAIRGGDVIGDHTVHLFGPGERLELTHRATNRDLFAHGALRAARWMVGRAAGRYSIGDALGIV